MLGPRLRAPRGVLAGAVAVLAVPCLAQAATFTVTKTADTADGACDADCSLREAVIAANAAAGADEILVPAGRYALTRAGDSGASAQDGDLDLTDDATIRGAGPFATVIDAGGIDRAFDAAPGTTILIESLGVTGGVATAAFTGGGAVKVTSGALTIRDARLVENAAIAGGAIYCLGPAASVRIERTEIMLNAATNGGGAVAVEGAGPVDTTAAEIVVSLLHGNRATGTGAGGGGVLAQGFARVTVEDSTLSDNEARSGGGGILLNGAFLTLGGATISGNRATDPGATGGGIRFLANGPARADLTHATVADNAAALATQVGSNEFAGTLTFGNSIVAGTGTLCSASPGGRSRGGNLDESDTCGFDDPSDVVDMAPLLHPLRRDAGPTPTHALGAGSPAIGLGLPANCGAADQRGLARDGACDAGAYERDAAGGCAAELPTVRTALEGALAGENSDPGVAVVCLLALAGL